MKKTITTIFALILSLSAIAQTGNVVLFTEGGERFTAILNGLQINQEPVTNLKIEDLTAPNYKLKVIFEDRNLGEMDKNLYASPGNEVTINIKQNKKGIYVLRLVSEVPLAQAPAPASNVTVIHYDPNPQPATEVTVVEQTTTTTTTSGNPPANSGENFSMNVNVDGFGMNVNVNANEGSMNSSSSVTTTTTTTTTGTQTGMNTQVYDNQVYEEPSAGTAVAYDNNCYGPMGDADFQDACASIRSKTFEDSQMTLAKQITKNNCLNASQVRTVMDIFDFESSKLEFAKYAYSRCVDTQNYYKVNDAFEFESSIEELDEYISGR